MGDAVAKGDDDVVVALGHVATNDAVTMGNGND